MSDRWNTQVGDCLEVMKGMADNTVDSVVCDPPAGIGFMGKDWDHDKGGRTAWVAWMTDVAREALRVLKPGGHAVVWALPRTSHWTAWAWEDAGFEVRDCVLHLFGSGFPKSLAVDKAIDKAEGVEREVVAPPPYKRGKPTQRYNEHRKVSYDCDPQPITAPATDAAKQWQGWGTALKPAAEYWWLLRKPLSEPTVAANVLRWGTGALNIDGCRVAHASEADRASATPQGKVTSKESESIGAKPDAGRGLARQEFNRPDTSKGRWPAHVVHDGSPEVVAGFPLGKSGVMTGKKGGFGNSEHVYGENSEKPEAVCYADSGSAARFFYQAKTSTSERHRGLPDGEKNQHPTVKPVELMRWLVRLVTPPGGLVLDPFMGSGSTGCAAMVEGLRFQGVDQDESYVAVARLRVAHAEAHPEEWTPREKNSSSKTDAKTSESQLEFEEES